MPRVPDAPRIAAIMVVRDEESIILDSIGHLLRNLGVDRVLVRDNGSTDATPALLDRIARLDDRLRWSPSPGAFTQDVLMSDLAEEARAEGIDWVIPVDADEFLDPGPAGFAPLAQAKGIGAFEMALRHFVQCRPACRLLTGRDPARALETMIFSAEMTGDAVEARQLVESGAIPFLRMTYPPKYIFRTAPGLFIERGSHGAEGIAGERAPLPGATLLHAPLRTFDDLRRRQLHAERIAAIVADPNISWHKRRLLTLPPGGLAAEWRANSTLLGGIGGPGRGLRLDLRLRRLVRGLADFRAEVHAAH